jgi:hypothetical protein
MRTGIVSIGPLLVLVLLTLVLAACSPDTSRKVELEAPENTCQAVSVSWQGLVVGQSTKTDVIAALGQPIQTTHVNRRESIYVYPPTMRQGFGNVILLRDDVVDWIDVWVADSDGNFHTLAEFVQIYGSTLDRVSENRSGDIVGPGQVYVWSECGVALIAVSEHWVKRSDDEILPLAEFTGMKDYEWIIRYPVPVDPRDVPPEPDAQQIVFRQLFFRPTSFASFQEFYASMIRHLGVRHYRQRLAGAE